MNKKMRELMSAYESKVAEATKATDATEKKAFMDEADSIMEEFEVEKRIFEASKAIEPTEEKAVETKTEVKTTPEADFAKAVKNFILNKAMSEGVPADGGYTVPEDIQTKINYWPEEGFAFADEIEVVKVSTNKGARTYQKKGTADVFVDLDENGAITGELTAPKFERITYSITDKAGFLPISNDLINDSDANIVSVVTTWIGKSTVSTDNAKILGLIQTKPQLEVVGVDGIKGVVNKTLGQAYKNSAKIYVNDDGLNMLDTLKDENGRYLLNPDPTDSAKLQLRAGSVVVPVKVIPNSIMPTTGTYAKTTDTKLVAGKIYYVKVTPATGDPYYEAVKSPKASDLSTYYVITPNSTPIIIGDLKVGITKWDRQLTSIMASNVATIGTFNAYANNMTLLRAITRSDYTLKDADAFVYGNFTLSE